jgi:O-succinylbenzoate synthase
MAIGNDFSIRLDANHAWTLDQAQVALHAFQPYGIEFLEEPLRSPEPGDMRRLSDATGVALALDELLSGVAALNAFIEHDGADYLVLKAAWLPRSSWFLKSACRNDMDRRAAVKLDG